MTQLIENTVNGRSFLVPEGDTDSVRYHTGTDEQNIGIILNHVPYDRAALCVQAGGNLGYFPIAFSKIFSRVITFEPDHVNFQCLSHNCTEENIIKLQAALGYDRMWVEIEVPDVTHVGLNQVKLSGQPMVPTLRIDDLALPACDLIQLDLEGFEYQALLGAIETITKFRPILAIELVGHTARYGGGDGDKHCYELLAFHGYQLADTIYNDRIFIPT